MSQAITMRQVRPVARSPLTIGVALLYVFLWSSAFIAAKVGIHDSPPLTLLAARFLLSSVLLAGIVTFWQVAWPRGWRAWGRLALFGLLNTAIFLGCGFESMEHLSAGLATIIAAANPLLLALVAPLVLRERLTAARIAGLVLGFGGVVFVMSYRLSGGHSHIDTLGGAITAVLGVVSLVAATVMYKRWTPTEHPLVVNTVQLGAGGLAMLVAALLVEHPQRVHVTVPLALAVLYLVVAVSIIASLLWFWLLSAVMPAR